MRFLVIFSFLFSLPALAEDVQLQVGFNIFKCVLQNDSATCDSPSIAFETVDINLVDGSGEYKTTYTRDQFVFEYSIRVSRYFNRATNLENYLLYVDLYSYVQGNNEEGTLSSVTISTVNFESLNQIEVDGSVMRADNVLALPFFGVAPANRDIVAQDREATSLKSKIRRQKIRAHRDR